MILAIVIAQCLYQHKNDTGLIASAGASGGIFALIRTDRTTSQLLLISVGLSYIAFHMAYCSIVARSLAQGDGFMAVTIVVALTILAIVCQSPSLTHLWLENNEVSSLWAIFPLHMGTVFFSAVIVRKLQVGITQQPLLPTFEPTARDTNRTLELESDPHNRRALDNLVVS